MSLKSKIQALITAANAKTGETDATLTDAVQTLVDGYGQGGTPVINPLSVTANGTYTAPSGVDGYSPVTVNVQGGGGLPEGITELYTGTFTPSENTANYTVNHNLGKYPKVFICFLENDIYKYTGSNGTITGFCQFLFNRNVANYANAYTATYTAHSSGNPYAEGGAAGIVAGTDLNNVFMTSNSSTFHSTVAVWVGGRGTLVPAVYRWIFLA